MLWLSNTLSPATILRGQGLIAGLLVYVRQSGRRMPLRFPKLGLSLAEYRSVIAARRIPHHLAVMGSRLVLSTESETLLILKLVVEQYALVHCLWVEVRLPFFGE